jgi:hypothetical protein
VQKLAYAHVFHPIVLRNRCCSSVVAKNPKLYTPAKKIKF